MLLTLMKLYGEKKDIRNRGKGGRKDEMPDPPYLVYGRMYQLFLSKDRYMTMAVHPGNSRLWRRGTSRL
jgi:hypothetical protein